MPRCRTSPDDTSPPTSIQGGYLPLSTAELCAVWGHYREGSLRAVDVRVWLACHEMGLRRRASRSNFSSFSMAELATLVAGGGGERGLRSALRRLGQLALLPDPAGRRTRQDPASCATGRLMEQEMHPKRRHLVLPRRMVRVLCGSTRRAVLATVFAQALWCLYLQREGGFSATGNCKASWIATTFGTSERSVLRARQHLEGLGWLVRVQMPQWHLNRYGARYTVRCDWERPLAREAGEHALSPPCPQNDPQLSPPVSNPALSTRSRNQEPTRGEFDLCSAEKKKDPAKPPSLRRLVPEDLRATERTLRLFAQACERGWVSNCEADRLNFVAAAERARVRGSSNPCGLFLFLVRNQLWMHLNQDDEDAARRRLREELYGEAPPSKSGGAQIAAFAGSLDPHAGHASEPARDAPAKPREADLSTDALHVQAVQQVVQRRKAKISGFLAMKQIAPEWTRERWDRALAELEIHRRSRLDERERRTLAFLAGEEGESWMAENRNDLPEAG